MAIYIFCVFTKSIYLNYTDVRAGCASGVGGGEGVRVYRCTSQMCVGKGEGSQKLTKSQYFGSS